MARLKRSRETCICILFVGIGTWGVFFCIVGKFKKRGIIGEMGVVIHSGVINDILSHHIIPNISITDMPAQLYFLPLFPSSSPTNSQEPVHRS